MLRNLFSNLCPKQTLKVCAICDHLFFLQNYNLKFEVLNEKIMEKFSKSSDELTAYELVDKYVRIDIKHKPTICGLIHTIDPISETVVIVLPKDKEQKTKVSLVMTHQIDSIQVLDRRDFPGLDTSDLFSSHSQPSKSGVAANRIERVVSLLEKNRLPVEIEFDEDKGKVLSILDTVRIRSPYGPDECESTNELILDRIRQLLTSLNDQ